MYATLSRRRFLRLTASGAIAVAAAACVPAKSSQSPTPAVQKPTLQPTAPLLEPTLQTSVQIRPVPKGIRRYAAGCSQSHVITSLCLRCGACAEVCPVECIVPGKPVNEWPLYYIDPDTCIDCGACVPECPWGAIFSDQDVPSYLVDGTISVRLNMPAETPGFNEVYDALDRQGKPVHLEHTRILRAGDMVDLTPDCEENARFFTDGPGYGAMD